MTTIAEIKERWEKASPGPWHWAGNTATQQLWLATWVKGLGRTSVMDFVRWGMRGAQPRFISDEFMMEKASDQVVWEVAPTATSPNDRRLYRHDVIGIRHPDAEAIAAAPADVATLLATIARVEALEEEWGTRASENVGLTMRHIQELRVALDGGESDD